jgi:Uma2 family endonuclease
MIVATPFPADFDDLMQVEGKAELIGGRIVELMPSGYLPGRVARRITRSLEDHVPVLGFGEAFGDNVGFALDQPLRSGRQSFSPDAAYHLGPFPANRMRFVDGAPTFGVEVRSENDYGPAAERSITDKRADYFEAGTAAVWDVDPIAETVTAYFAADPLVPVVFRRGNTAHAEPAVPGWRLPIDSLFA